MLKKITQRHHASPRQVALRFLLRRFGTFTIVKASDPQHVADNAGAGDLQFAEAEYNEIDHASPLAPEPAELPVL